jgi:hypothetical protein
MDLILDFVFIAATTLSLFLLYHRTKCVRDEDDSSDDDERSTQTGDNDDDEESTALLKKYIFSIRELKKRPNEADEAGSMPSFETMMDPKRRCFSLSDLDSLNLINDHRIAADFNSALESVFSEPSVDVESERADTPGSLLSWDEIDSEY